MKKIKRKPQSTRNQKSLDRAIAEGRALRLPTIILRDQAAIERYQVLRILHGHTGTITRLLTAPETI